MAIHREKIKLCPVPGSEQNSLLLLFSGAVGGVHLHSNVSWLNNTQRTDTWKINMSAHLCKPVAAKLSVD